MNEFSVPEFRAGDDKMYEMEPIWDSAFYTKEADGHLQKLYYLVAWKGYLKEENTWEPFLTVIHLRKMASTFYKDHSEKLTMTSVPLGSTLLIAKPTFHLSLKRK